MASHFDQMYTQLLRSNLPPSRSDELLLRAKDNEIQRSLKISKKEVRSLELRRKRLRTLLAPLRRIPRDVLLRILRVIKPPPSTNSFYLKSKSSPWMLAQVCSTWRSIIHDTPLFWSTLYIDVDYELPKHFLSILCTILQRTKSADLDIVFTAPTPQRVARNVKARSQIILEQERLNADSKRILEILSTYSRQWKSMHVAIPLDHWDCLRQIEGSLPRLETLSLDILGITKSFDADGRCNFFARAPKLRCVALGTRYQADVPPMSLSLPTTELTINLDPVILDYLPEIILSSVTKLTLQPSWSSFQCYNSPSVVPTFRNVKYLHAVQHTLWYLTLPNLEEINLSKWEFDDVALKEVTQFLCRSRQALSAQRRPSKLVISSYHPNQRMLELFLLFPSIRSLTLDLSSPFTSEEDPETYMKNQLKDLIISDPLHIPFPLLTELRINSCHDFPSLRKLVHKVVTSRIQPPDWFMADPGRRKLLRFFYKDRKHKSITISTYRKLLD